MFQISVLGLLEVRRDGQLVDVPGGKTSELLVRLAVEAGAVVGADRLVDDLWADAAVTTRRNTLQSKVARLRRALGDPSVIESRDGGYRLTVEPTGIDMFAMLDQATTAGRLLEQGDYPGAVDLSVRTLDLCDEHPLRAAGDGAWIEPHRARLVAARMQLVETRYSARSHLGTVGDMIGELEGAVSQYPYQETLWQLLITAQYRLGRQADALANVQRVRKLLADDLGLEPGPSLRQLEQQILVHDPSLGGVDRGTGSWESHAPTGNLPSMSAELVGRASEVHALADLLATNRLVEIVGVGGIGKTAVAIATGRMIDRSEGVGRDGVWLARLETATTADEVTDELIAALQVTGGEAAVVERLRGGGALVILDNCEHVIDEAAALAVRLLDAAPGLRVLCTSQVPLGIDGEILFELAPLALSDAVDLFTLRAVTRGGGAVSDVADTVQDLCRSLDGLPLAIELAAARTRTLSIEEITRRLDDRFDVLSDPTSRRPERRRALRATIGWSYDLLFPDDQRGLWALATFSGGAPLAGVEFVLEALDVPATAAIDVVGRLASRSLVIVDGDDGPTPVRYRLLDSIRAYALDALAGAEETDRTLAAHAAWFAKAARSSTSGVRSSHQSSALSFARSERANIDAALAWSGRRQPSLALEIANGFGWAWVVLGDSRGAQRLLAALDAVGPAAPIPDRANALLLAGWIEASTDHLELAVEHIREATELAEAIDDVDLQARASYYLAYVVSHLGDFGATLELTDRSDALYEGLDRPWDQAANWLFAARAAISAGDLERSAAARDRVQHWLSLVEDPWLRVRREAMLGELARVERRFDDAVRHIGRAADASRELGFLQTEAYQVSSLGRAQCQDGDYDAGAATLELAIEKAEATGDLRMAALARVHLGRVLHALGRPERARTALESAAAWHRDAGGGEQAALGECLLAALDAADQRPGAEERLVAILEESRRDHDAHVEVFALDALARIAAERGDTPTATERATAADRRMEAASHFITDRDRSDARRVRELL